MAIDAILDSALGRGKEFEAKGLLRRVPMGGLDVIDPKDPELSIGTSALADCAGIGLADKNHQVAGIAHVRFAGSFDRFSEFADQLLAMGHEHGGEHFTLFLVNVRSGWRRLAENQELERVATKWVTNRTENTGDIACVQWINASGFSIDKNTGNILPY